MTSAFRSITRRPLRLAAATLVLALAGGVSLCASAQPMPGGHEGPGGPTMMEHGHRHGMDTVLAAAGASADQIAKIKAIFAAARSDMKGLHSQGAGAHEQMEKLLAAPNLDTQAIETLHAQMQAQRDQAGNRMMQAMVSAAQVLTPEQRGKVDAILQARRLQMRERLEERRAHWDHMHGEPNAGHPGHAASAQ